MEKKHKRRNYFIDREAQSRFMASFAVASLFAGFIAAITFVYLAEAELEQTIYKMRLPDTAMANLLLEEMAITTVVGIVSVALLFSFTVGKIFVRIEGPLMKMGQVIQRIKAGDLSGEVALRENDEFQSVAVALNDLLKKLKASMTVIEHNSYALSTMDNRDPETDPDFVLDLQKQVQTLKKELDSFSL